MKEDGGIPTASDNDPRLTKYGKWIRRFKIDEIPTIWNLFKGDINLVGIRPDTPEEFETFDETTKKLLFSRKPGIVSPATIWNYEESTILSAQAEPHKYYTEVIKPVKYYLNKKYLEERTLWLDIKIMFAYMFKLLRLPYLWMNIYPRYFYGRTGKENKN
jgi:lipopolysaccharide/colanic/teichoic acid biosynthesis glycosyltransferase